MRTVDGGFYPIQPSDKCKPEDHGKLNDHVVSIEDVEGHVLWKRSPPIGWRLVPTNPTEDMLDAALAVHEAREGEDEEFLEEFKRTYRAMLTAAPAKQEEAR